MLSESCPRHVPAAGDASGAAELGLKAVMPISALSQSAPPFANLLLFPVIQARSLELQDYNCGQNLAHRFCVNGGLGPNPALLHNDKRLPIAYR